MATTIKVDRVILLDALTTKLAEQEKLQAQHDKAVEQYEKAEKAWHEKIATACKKFPVWRVHVRAWSEPVVEIEYKVNLTDLPTQPEKPDYPRGLSGDLDELRKTIRLLQMTAEPNVPASVYKSVSTWL